MGSTFCSLLPQKVVNNGNTKNWKGWISRWKCEDSPLIILAACSAKVGDSQEGSQKSLAKLQACYLPDSVPLATTRAVTVPSLPPSKSHKSVFEADHWSRKCSLRASRPCFPQSTKGTRKYTETLTDNHPKVRPGATAVPLSALWCQTRAIQTGPHGPTWAMSWIFYSYKRARNS